MALINLETSLSTSHFRAKAQRSKNSKMDSKMESWLWRFMENLGIEGYALWSHNFSSYTLHKTYTSDTQQNWTRSCALLLKTNSHFWQKISNLKTKLEVDSSKETYSITFLGHQATHLDQNHKLPSPET